MYKQLHVWFIIIIITHHETLFILWEKFACIQNSVIIINFYSVNYIIIIIVMIETTTYLVYQHIDTQS